jgi:tellurite resistance protein
MTGRSARSGPLNSATRTTAIEDTMTMQATLTAPRLFGNTSSELSKEERREIEFWASARMSAAEIANRIRRSAEEVKAYCNGVRLNIE